MRKLLMLLVSLMLVSTACAGGGDEAARPTPGEEAEGGDKKIRVTGDEYSFDLPSTVEGGFVQIDFKNDGQLVHEAAFVKSEPEAPQEQFVKDFKGAISEGPIAAHLKPYFLSEEVKPGETGVARQALPAGTYYLVCTLSDADSKPEDEGQEGGEQDGGEEPELPQHFEQGMIKKVTVTGPSTVSLPEADASIAAKEYSFDVKGLKAGKNEVLFRNDGPAQIHMAAVLEFPEGVDEAKAREAFSAGEGPPPPGTPEPDEVGFGGVFEVGGGSVFSVDLKKGRVYGIACFIQDRAGGPPHIAKGMVTVTTIS